MSIEQQLYNLQVAFLAGLIGLVPAAFLFLRNYLDMRKKLLMADVREREIDIDDTAARNKLSADAQALIQKMYIEQNNRIKMLEDNDRHLRDLIDTGASERATLTAQKNSLETLLNEARTQQMENVKKLAAMETLTGQLKAFEAENVLLKNQVNELSKKVEEAEIKSEQRHADMSRITGANAELEVSIRTLRVEADNLRRLLRECHEQEIEYKKLISQSKGGTDSAVSSPE
jgi:chromosome segregation ATPase